MAGSSSRVLLPGCGDGCGDRWADRCTSKADAMENEAVSLPGKPSDMEPDVCASTRWSDACQMLSGVACGSLG